MNITNLPQAIDPAYMLPAEAADFARRVIAEAVDAPGTLNHAIRAAMAGLGTATSSEIHARVTQAGTACTRKRMISIIRFAIQTGQVVKTGQYQSVRYSLNLEAGPNTDAVSFVDFIGRYVRERRRPVDINEVWAAAKLLRPIPWNTFKSALYRTADRHGMDFHRDGPKRTLVYYPDDGVCLDRQKPEATASMTPMEARLFNMKQMLGLDCRRGSCACAAVAHA